MDERTRQALLGSIAKWEAIVQGLGGDQGGTNCPLCQEFMDQRDPEDPESEMGCFGCPVRAASGFEQCNGTPYGDWARATPWQSRLTETGRVMERRVETEEQHKLAQCELDFLKSLQEEYPE